MKNKYDKINDLNIHYKESDLSQKERENLIELSKSYGKSLSNKKKILAIAAALALAFTISFPKVRADIGGIVTNVSFSIVDTLGSAKSSGKYVTHLGEDVELFDNTIRIENIVFDGNRMYMDIIADADYMDDVEEFPSVRKIQIGDETYKVWGSSGSSYVFDKESNLAISTMMNTLDKDLIPAENTDVTLFFNKSLLDSQAVTIKSNVNLADDEKIMLADNMEIRGTDGLILEYMKINPITAQARFLNLNDEYDYLLEGYDSEGNFVEFDLRTIDESVGDFFINPSFSEISLEELSDGRVIKLQLYRSKINQESGKLTDGSYEKYGEEFTLKPLSN